jgi:hypothetical protein
MPSVRRLNRLTKVCNSSDFQTISLQEDKIGQHDRSSMTVVCRSITVTLVEQRSKCEIA